MRWVAGASALLLAGILSACGDARNTRAGAPPALRAVLVLEPRILGVGEVGLVELSVVTPPGHAVHPVESPVEVAGLWLLGSEALEVEKRASRWVHRTRLRVRAREVGSLEWPAGTLDVEAPDGSVASVSFEALPIEVASVLPEYPDRLSPFGMRSPEPEVGSAGSLASAAAGAGLTLAVLAVVALVRRRMRDRASSGSAAEPREPPWVTARTALATAREQVDLDPLAAADGAVRALRRYMARRFGADAEARTTEELAAAIPPFAATSRWPRFVALLEELDAQRFPPHESVLAQRIAALVAEVEAFVEETIPDGARS